MFATHAVLGLLNTNARVYKRRWIALPLTFGLLSMLTLLFHLWTAPVTCLVSMLVMFFYYDLLSGILHVVLDEPSFISLPLIGEGCLEFQWHHHLPDDIYSKSFLEVCGDLNLVLSIILVKDLLLFKGVNPTALCLCAAKVLMAYFGQLCHCMCHAPRHCRPAWVTTLQELGLMLHPREHATHHAKYDDNFCIGSGMFNPFVKSLLPMGGKWTWLGVFIALMVFDVHVMNRFLCSSFGFQ